MNLTPNSDTEKETSTEKALRILECFIPFNDELSSARLTELTGYHRATTSRTIKILEHNGYLHQNSENKKYKLGPKIKLLNNALEHSTNTDLLVEIRAILNRLRNTTGETVVYETLHGNAVIPSIAFRGNGPLFVDIPVGLPVMWNTSSGLIAMLAFASDDIKEAFMSQPMSKATETSITDLNLYKRRLEETKERGYAITIDEPVLGIVNLAYPIFDFSGKVLASVNIAGPKERVLPNKEELLVQLKSAAQEITDIFRV